MSSNRPFIASPQQAAFFKFLETGTGSLVLEAVAGSGKTETLARGARYMRGSIAALMFNKAAAVEFKQRAERVGTARDRFFISTCHAAGLNAWRRFWPNFEVDEKKVPNLIDRIALDMAQPEINRYIATNCAPFVAKMVSFGKQMLAGVKFDVHNRGIWMKIAAHYGADGDLPEDVTLEEAISLVIEVFLISGRMCKPEDVLGLIDFDDMIWAPLAYNARFFTNDWVLIDEAQDTNPSRRELARRMLRPGGRLIAVGDSRQAIYGFTGASADALDLIATEFRCSRLPLSITYRCPKSVVSFVQQWVSHIQAGDEAPEGEVRPVVNVQPKKGDKALPWFIQDPLTPQDAVICRYNKPLVSTAFQLLKEGIACKMEGRDIGKGLIALAKRWKVKTLDALENRLKKYQDKEVQKARARKSETAEQGVIDRVGCLMVFIERCRLKGADRVECVVAEIDDLFADDVKGVVTLCSSHRSKGREWPRVFWIQTEIKGRDLQDWELVQEDNLKYVTGTRAQEMLVLVPEALVGEKKQ